MFSKLSLTLLFLAIAAGAHAQCDETATEASATHRCASARQESFRSLAKVTVASLAEDQYDVKYVKLDVSLTNTTTFITGSVISNAVVVAPTMPGYVFELASNMTIDSVKINGVARTWTTSGVVRTVALPSAMTQGTAFTAQVWYRGTANRGLYNDDSPSWGTDATWSLSQPYNANGWWPCKQSLQDKIDSCDVWVSVANTLKAGSNGLLKNVTALTGNRSRYEWKHRYPVDYYLISVATAPYVDYTFHVTFPGSTDSMPVQNYVYGDNAQVLPFWKTRIDSTKGMIQHLSTLFGRYPFWQEKYGHCMAPLGGGMEHQTMTTQGNFGTELTVHELGHQWFGDAVTCATWSDIWLNEGFASYCEYLYREQFQSAASAASKMLSVHNSVMRDQQFQTPLTTGSVYVIDTANEGRLFSSRLTYDKGSAAVHSLRFLVGNDSTFFAMLRNYQTVYKFKTATTEDFKNTAETFLSRDLDTFFNQWIYGEGYPIFSATWNQNGNDVVLNITQTNANTSTSSTVPLYFATPLEVRLTSPAGDTTVRVNLSGATTRIDLPWSKTMTGLRFDPANWLMNDSGTVAKDPSLLSLQGIADHQPFKVFPNPTRDAWHVGGLQPGSALVLTDLAGRAVWRDSGDVQAATVPAAGLPAGVYILRVHSEGSVPQSVRLVKQ